MMKIHVRRFGRWFELFPLVFLLQACVSGAYLPGQQTDGRLIRQYARYNLKVDDQESVFTLLEGEMTLTRPTYLELKPGQQIRVSAAGVEEVRSLSGAELEEVTRWRSQFPPPCAGGGGECAPPGRIAQCGQCTD
jgi:hypothetical protein